MTLEDCVKKLFGSLTREKGKKMMRHMFLLSEEEKEWKHSA